MGVNSVILAGYIGGEPQIFERGEFKTGRISVGTNAFRNKQAVTDWHNVELFGAAATYAEKYIKKGDYVVVTGYLSMTEYTTRDGVEKKLYNIKALTIEKPKVKEDERNDEPPNRSSGYSRNSNDDLPY